VNDLQEEKARKVEFVELINDCRKEIKELKI
jgi:hypothetical protein